jgi:hypothetical protein
MCGLEYIQDKKVFTISIYPPIDLAKLKQGNMGRYNYIFGIIPCLRSRIRF